jgi:hypothetical protein
MARQDLQVKAGRNSETAPTASPRPPRARQPAGGDGGQTPRRAAQAGARGNCPHLLEGESGKPKLSKITKFSGEISGLPGLGYGVGSVTRHAKASRGRNCIRRANWRLVCGFVCQEPGQGLALAQMSRAQASPAAPPAAMTSAGAR